MKENTTLIFFGALAGLFPILLTWTLSRLEKRSFAAKRDQALNLAKKRVEFLDTWVNAQKGLCSNERFEEIKREVSDELDQLMETLSERLAEEEDSDADERNIDERNLLERLLLVYYPYNVAGWVLHILFYMFFGMTLLSIPLYKPGFLRSQFSVGQFMTDSIIIIVVLILPMLIIRWLAVRADRKAEEKIAALAAEKGAFKS